MSGRRKKVLFDQTQNERGKLESTYSELGKLLRDSDFDVEPYTEFMIQTQTLKDVDVLVYSSAVTVDNPEVKAAVERKIPVIKRAEMLDALMKQVQK